jgi:hypothetical protein
MDAPKRIWAWPDRGRRESVTGRWSCNTYSSDLTEAYILATEHERLLSEARNKALEEAAKLANCGCECREAMLPTMTEIERWTTCGNDPCGALVAAAIRALKDAGDAPS